MESYESTTNCLLDNIIVPLFEYLLKTVYEITYGNTNLDKYKILEIQPIVTEINNLVISKIDNNEITVYMPIGMTWHGYINELSKNNMQLKNLYVTKYELLTIVKKHMNINESNADKIIKLYKKMHANMLTVDRKIETEYLKSKKLQKINTAKMEFMHSNTNKSHENRRDLVDSLTEFIAEDIQTPCTCNHIQYEKYLLSLEQITGSGVNLKYRTRDGDKRLSQAGIHKVVKDVFDRVAPSRKIGHAPVNVPCIKHGIK